VIVLVAVLLVVAAGAGYVALRPKRSPYAAAWDPRVEPLARYASDHRKLAWEHPITVEFLSAGAYHQAVVGDEGDSGAGAKAFAADKTAEMRAIGLLEGPLDLQAAGNTLADDGTLAFYSPKTKRAYVRGTELTPGVRVTLVHELTHALQDQHFDLTALEDRYGNDPALDGDALRGLVEGDAMRIEASYRDQLSAADRAAAEREQTGDGQQGQRVRQQVPPSLVDLFGAPYDFGEPFVRLLAGVRGESGVDDAFRSPPTAFAQVWDPFVYLGHDQMQQVDGLHPPSGAKQIDAGTFGSMVLYEMLIQRMAPTAALTAVDGWAGDQFVAYKAGGAICVDGSFKGATTADDDELYVALVVWQGGRPAGTASVARNLDHGIVTMHTCDPGANAKLGITDHSADLAIPVVRAQLAMSLLDELAKGARPNDGQLATMRCLANQVVHHYSGAQLGAAEPPAGFERTVAQLTVGCLASPYDYPGAPHR
jgi:hypothetical protein